MFIGLQYLRAGAAVLVVLYYFLISSVFIDSWFAEHAGLIKFGSIGADLFFVLSGFIIAYSTYNSGKPLSRIKFLLLRLVRIYPMYWVFSLCVLIIYISSLTKEHIMDYEHIIKSFILFPIIDSNGENLPLLIVGWTLVLEMYFYLTFCMFFTLGKWKAFASLFVVMTLLFFIGGIYFNGNPLANLVSTPHIFEFLLGYFIYNMHSHPNIAGKFKKYKHFFILLAACCFLVLFIYWDVLGASLFIIKCVFSGAVVILAIQSTQTGLSRVGKVSKLIGDSSYSLYLSHIIFVMIITGIWKRDILAPVIGFEMLYILSATIVCIVFGVIYYTLIERKCNKYLANVIRMKFA
jgi:exopolysaccharide production protein ExoZ